MFAEAQTWRRRSYVTSRRGGTTGVVLVFLALIAAVGAGVYWKFHQSKSSGHANVIYETAQKGTFIHEVNGKGSAESAKNIDVASQVEGAATVIYLIPEGSDVKKGDLLVELDSSDVDEKLDSQTVQTNSSRATLNNSRATLRSAEISLEEYVEGTFEQNWKEYENTIFDAEQTRKQKADISRFTERLLNLNYSTELQYEIDKVAEESAKNSLEVTNLKKMTLLKYTSEKQITSLMSDIETARAKVDSDKNSYNINLNRENRYRAQSANCKIKAPQDGQVVYANQDSRRMSESEMIKEGSTVRQRQVLIRLPDKTQMQVKTMINESNISSVKVGMPAKITFDSMPNRVVEGEVTKVNLYPEIVWMSSAKDYVTLVKIKEDIPELRSGLTAQVRIIADEQKDVLMVPVQCVTEYGKKTYCVTYKDGVWGCKEVLLGASNEKQVIVLDGLKEGDVVVSGARLYRENVTFPDVNAPSQFENSEIYQQKVAELEAEEAKQKEIEASGGEEAVAGAPGAGGGRGPGAGGGFPGAGAPGAGGGFPGMGGAGGGIPAGMLPEGFDPSKLAALFGRGGGGAGGGDDDSAGLQDLQENAETYTQTIEDKLAHDSKVAAIQPFFTRTVMEMQRELLAAISTKTSALQARVASRQNEITRRQEEIELLQNAQPVEGSAAGVATSGSESAESRIARLTDEIKKLRGDSDADPLERISYLDQVDWTKYVSGNDITRDGLNFLIDDPDELFESMFPNSEPVDVAPLNNPSSDKELETVAAGDEKEEIDDSEMGILRHEKDSDYLAFGPLFEDWDANADGVMKPTEFVIGFFTDRKSFQDSETDDEIDKLFKEYAPEDDQEATEISFENVKLVAERILSERIDVSEMGGRRGGRRGFGGFGRQGGQGLPNGLALLGGQGGPNGLGPQGEQGAPNGVGPQAAQNAPVQNGEQGSGAAAQSAPALPNAQAPQNGQEGAPNLPSPPADGQAAPEGQGPAPEGMRPPKPEPIKSLGEAKSLRQAIAFFISQMDFNNDGLLQKNEFVKGYNDVNDVVGKLFASTILTGSTNSGADGGFGPPR